MLVRAWIEMFFGFCCFWFMAQILFCLRMSRVVMMLFVSCAIVESFFVRFLDVAENVDIIF
jgi:hypothetical protein